MGGLFKSKDFNMLAEKLKVGEQKAGEEIFNYFSPKIFRYFMVRLSDRDAAEDLTQEVFIKLVSKIKTFDKGIGNFSGWIWRIAKNTLTDHFRQKKPIPFSSLDDAFKNSISDKKSFVQEIINDNKVKEITKLVENFSEEEQEIFSLHYLSDVPYKEMSRMTKKSAGALRIAVHRINKKIREVIHYD